MVAHAVRPQPIPFCKPVFSLALHTHTHTPAQQVDCVMSAGKKKRNAWNSEKFPRAQTICVDADKRNKRAEKCLLAWFGRLIESLGDKPSDIRYPSGQGMGG